MGLFSRKPASPDLGEDLGEDTEAPPPEPPAGEPGVDRDWDRTVDGPFDIAERTELGPRLDLGALRVPAVTGMEIRLEVEQGSGQLTGVICGLKGSQLQVQAFAAPRSLGLWEDIRDEIADGIREAGGSAEEKDGLLGPELHCSLPAVGADRKVTRQPARFVGVDGPRWFVRAVLSGPAATDDAAYQVMLTLLRQVVVDRGEEPRPPREVLTLTAPDGVLEAAAAAQGRSAESADPADEVQG